MKVTKRQIEAVVKAACALPRDAMAAPLESFVASVLGMPIPAVATNLKASAAVESALGKAQDDQYLKDCIIPTFYVFDAPDGRKIAGFSTWLATAGRASGSVAARLASHDLISAELSKISRGQDLEAIAAGLLDAAVGRGDATQGGSDAGIDAIGRFLPDWLEPPTSGRRGEDLPPQNVFILASCKATIRRKARKKGSARFAPALLQPDKLRELVGSWVIQRTTHGAWNQQGIKALSPIQLVLATTYRLSDESWLHSRHIGVIVWTIPELVGLICRFCPDSVFGATGNAFDSNSFVSWWRRYDAGRLLVPSR